MKWSKVVPLLFVFPLVDNLKFALKQTLIIYVFIIGQHRYRLSSSTIYSGILVYARTILLLFVAYIPLTRFK